MGRPRVSEAVRERLLDAGLEMIGARGYHATGIKDLVEAVGVPKGSFYSYFESKEDFVVELVRRFGDASAEKLDAALRNPKADALAALERFYRGWARQCEQQEFREGCFIGNLSGEIAASSLAGRKALSDAMAGWRERLREAIARGQAQGRIRDDLAARQLADFVINAWEGALLRMQVERSRQPLRDMIQLIFGELLPAEG